MTTHKCQQWLLFCCQHSHTLSNVSSLGTVRHIMEVPEEARYNVVVWFYYLILTLWRKIDISKLPIINCRSHASTVAHVCQPYPLSSAKF